jgi:hypothetical protein
MRHFKLVGIQLKSAHDADQLDAPHANLAVVPDNEAWMRAIQRAYSLGRQDKAADIRAALKET